MKILFTTPHFNEWCHIAFAYSLVKTRWPKGSSVNVVSCVGSSCAKANRMFVEMALKDNYDYVILTANDAGWKPDDICKLIDDNKDVVSGWSGVHYPPFHVKVFTEMDRENVLLKLKGSIGTGLEKVYSASSEITAYKVDVFRKIKPPWFSGILNKRGEVVADDFSFACRAYDAGVEIWVDWDVPIRHHAGGLLSYKGELVPQI